MLQWTCLGFCCWRNLPRENGPEEAATPIYCFIWGGGEGRNGAHVHLFLSLWSICSYRWSWLRIFYSYFPKPYRLDRLWSFPSDKFHMNMTQLPLIDLSLEFVNVFLKNIVSVWFFLGGCGWFCLGFFASLFFLFSFFLVQHFIPLQN